MNTLALILGYIVLSFLAIAILFLVYVFTVALILKPLYLYFENRICLVAMLRFYVFRQMRDLTPFQKQYLDKMLETNKKHKIKIWLMNEIKKANTAPLSN